MYSFVCGIYAVPTIHSDTRHVTHVYMYICTNWSASVKVCVLSGACKWEEVLLSGPWSCCATVHVMCPTTASPYIRTNEL